MFYDHFSARSLLAKLGRQIVDEAKEQDDNNQALKIQIKHLNIQIQELQWNHTKEINEIKKYNRIPAPLQQGTEEESEESEERKKEIRKYQDETKRKDKIINEMKKTQKMNESRIYDLNEEIRKHDAITTKNNEHLTILRDRNEELRRSNELMQQRNAKSTNGTGSNVAIGEHAGHENNAAPVEDTPDQGLPQHSQLPNLCHRHISRSGQHVGFRGCKWQVQIWQQM